MGSPVRAQIGLVLRLRSSLSQMSTRIVAVSGVEIPAHSKACEIVCGRHEILPSGSPRVKRFLSAGGVADHAGLSDGTCSATKPARWARAASGSNDWKGRPELLRGSLGWAHGPDRATGDARRVQAPRDRSRAAEARSPQAGDGSQGERAGGGRARRRAPGDPGAQGQAGAHSKARSRGSARSRRST